MISEGYAGVHEEKPVRVEQRGVEPTNSSNILIAYMSRIKLNIVAGRQRKTLEPVGIRPVGRFFCRRVRSNEETAQMCARSASL